MASNLPYLLCGFLFKISFSSDFAPLGELIKIVWEMRFKEIGI